MYSRPLFKRHILSAAVCTPLLAGTGVSNAAPQLEEVVITAQKRTESLQDVPISVSALSSSDMEGLKMRDAGEIAAQIPNLQAVNPLGDGFPIFSLRGVSMSDFSLNQSSPVASYVDEVYKGNPAIQGVQVYDLERIEVLRGPQGTLYGKNSTGGAVNFITRKPSFEQSGYIRLGVGDYSRKEAHGAFETPLANDTLAMRIAGTWIEQDGWFENKLSGVDDGSAVDEYGLRATFLWEPSQTLQFILRASTGKQEAVNYGIQAINITADGVGAGLYGLYNMLGATTAVDSQREGLDFFEFDSEQDKKRRIDNDAVSLTVNWDIGDNHSLTSISSWDDGNILNPEDADGTSNEVLAISYYGEAEQVSQDLRITSDNDGPFNYIAGLYYAREKVSNQTTIGFYTDLDMNANGSIDYTDCLDVAGVALGLGPQTPDGEMTEGVLNEFGLSLGQFFPAACQTQNDFDQDRTSKAIYADSSYMLTDSFTLRAGLRYTEDETDLEGFSARLLGSDGVPLFNTIPADPVDPYATAADRSIKNDEITGKIGIDYTTESGSLYYASFSHGYRNGSFNAQAFFDPSELTEVDPELLDAWELGFKSQLFDGSMELNGAAFFYSYEDQQFLNVDPVTLAQTLVNIDESEIAGLELETRYLPTDDLLLRAGVGILDTEVKDGNLSGVDLSGNELPVAPGVNFNLAADWQMLTTGLGALKLMADSSYVGDHYFEVFNVDRIEQDGYWVHNARLQFDSVDDDWTVALWVKNLSDEEYHTSNIDLQSSFGYDYSHIGAPRTFGAEFGYRF